VLPACDTCVLQQQQAACDTCVLPACCLPVCVLSCFVYPKRPRWVAGGVSLCVCVFVSCRVSLACLVCVCRVSCASVCWVSCVLRALCCLERTPRACVCCVFVACLLRVCCVFVACLVCWEACVVISKVSHHPKQSVSSRMSVYLAVHIRRRKGSRWRVARVYPRRVARVYSRRCASRHARAQAHRHTHVLKCTVTCRCRAVAQA